MSSFYYCCLHFVPHCCCLLRRWHCTLAWAFLHLHSTILSGIRWNNCVKPGHSYSKWREKKTIHQWYTIWNISDIALPAFVKGQPAFKTNWKTFVIEFEKLEDWVWDEMYSKCMKIFNRLKMWCAQNRNDRNGNVRKRKELENDLNWFLRFTFKCCFCCYSRLFPPSFFICKHITKIFFLLLVQMEGDEKKRKRCRLTTDPLIQFYVSFFCRT